MVRGRHVGYVTYCDRRRRNGHVVGTSGLWCVVGAW